MGAFDEIVGKAEELAKEHSDQVSEAAPVLVNEKTCEPGLNGPPKVPEALSPVPGSTPSVSGIARAMIRLSPFGLPQPVHRS